MLRFFSTLQINKHFAGGGGVCQPYLFFPCSKGGSALDHFVDEASQAEVVRAEGVLLVVDDLRRHVAHRAHAAPHRLALGDLHRQAEVRDPEIFYSC